MLQCDASFPQPAMYSIPFCVGGVLTFAFNPISKRCQISWKYPSPSLQTSKNVDSFGLTWERFLRFLNPIKICCTSLSLFFPLLQKKFLQKKKKTCTWFLQTEAIVKYLGYGEKVQQSPGNTNRSNLEDMWSSWEETLTLHVFIFAYWVDILLQYVCKQSCTERKSCYMLARWFNSLTPWTYWLPSQITR